MEVRRHAVPFEREASNGKVGHEFQNAMLLEKIHLLLNANRKGDEDLSCGLGEARALALQLVSGNRRLGKPALKGHISGDDIGKVFMALIPPDGDQSHLWA